MADAMQTGTTTTRPARTQEYQREYQQAAREHQADRANTHQQREMAYHTKEYRPDRQRESVREMYQRQLREARERPQERDTGRGR